MSAVKAPTGAAQKQAADTAPQDPSQHWSLAASAWPRAETPVSYVARARRTRARVQCVAGLAGASAIPLAP